MSRVSIGIDPGKQGGIAIIWEHQNGTFSVQTAAFDIIEYRKLIELARKDDCMTVRCCIERVGAMPGQGVKSMFSFGMNYGAIQGLLIANNVSYESVPPQKWKKMFSLGHDKKASIETAKRLFPEVSLKAGERSRTDSDGIAEALLIAEYCRRINNDKH